MTEADGVYIDFKRKDQRKLDRLTVEEAKDLLAKGEFPPGSMGPKIEAALTFLEGGGKKVIISSIKDGYLALEGQAGTTII
jgi:carbamate kinase